MIENGVDAGHSYYSHLRQDLLDLLPDNGGKVLDIGCGTGRTLEYLKSKGATQAIGIELREDVAQIARSNPNVDEVLCGDFLSLALPFPKHHFDVIVASFVLEHVADPWQAMKRIKSLLTPTGIFIGSLPNVRHLSVSLPLLFRGHWEYAEEGIMDWTHLRFFSRRTIEGLLQSTGFRIVAMKPEFSSSRAKALNLISAGLMQDLVGYAFNFVATPNIGLSHLGANTADISSGQTTNR